MWNMTCDLFREALSAHVDGEAADVPEAVIDDHLHTCSGCRAWSAAVEDLVRVTRISPAEPVPDLTAAILAKAPQPTPAADRWRRPVRWALAGVALVQLFFALPDLVFGGHPGGHVHMAHEVGSWDVALAFGFLVAALRPARAWGMLPLVAAIVGLLMVTTGLDVADGNSIFGRQSTHGLQVVGLALLWGLARRPILRRRTGLLQAA